MANQPGVRQRLEEISGTTLQAINEVREITRNLRPYQLDRLGLTQSIRALVRKVAEACPVEFACHVDEVDGLFEHSADLLGKYLRKRAEIDGEQHVRAFTGTDEELGALIAWLQKQKK